MRIAFYAPLKSPAHETPSGDRRVARLLMQALQLAGHQVDLVSDFRSHEGQGDVARQSALRDEGGRIARNLIARWNGPQCTEPPELWFTYHLYYKAPDWLGPPVCAALDIPYVAAEASYAAKRAGGSWAMGHEAAKHAIQAASLVLCPTRDDMEGILQIAAPGTHVVHLPPFLDTLPYRAAALHRAAHRARLASAHGLAADSPWIVVAAMMRAGDKLASYRQLAEAMREWTDLPWQMVVAGDGAAREEIEVLLEAAAPGRSRFLGLCSEEVLAGIYAACDLSVWPAVNEAYGMAMLEAQAAGVPVVSCAVRGVPDVVCDGLTGLLADSGDVLGLATLVRGLLLDAARRGAMGQAAAQFVNSERSTAQAAVALNQAFTELPRHAALRAVPVSLP